MTTENSTEKCDPTFFYAVSVYMKYYETSQINFGTGLALRVHLRGHGSGRKIIRLSRPNMTT